MSPRYIPLLSFGVGGAELRFVDIAEALNARGIDTILVIPAVLRNRLEKVRPKLPAKTVVIGNENDSFTVFLFKYALWIRKQRSTLHAFHYPLN